MSQGTSEGFHNILNNRFVAVFCIDSYHGDGESPKFMGAFIADEIIGRLLASEHSEHVRCSRTERDLTLQFMSRSAKEAVLNTVFVGLSKPYITLGHAVELSQALVTKKP